MVSRILFGVFLVQLALLVVLVSVNARLRAERKALSDTNGFAPPKSADDSAYFRGQPGPWGEVEYVRINIEPPDEFLPSEDGTFEPTQWFFEGYSADQLKQFLSGCELTAQQRDQLLDVSSWTIEPGGIVITPGAPLILELSAASREKIYAALAHNQRNELQRWPFSFNYQRFDDWFRGSRLSPNTLVQLRRLVYRRGDAVCFSDLPEIFSQVPTFEEKSRLLKALSRNSTVLMKLRVRPDSDINALTAYWNGGRAKDIGPLLESLTQIPQSATIDVAHLLPPFARKRLNTYPAPGRESDAGDCFWSVMNFFNDPPDQRYRDEKIWLAELQTNFVEVTQPTFGDAMFLLRPDGSPLHAAVYIADDVVFTKNGGSLRQPWLLMKWADMVARYPETEQPRVAVFRRR